MFEIPIDCCIGRVVRDDGTDVDAVNVVDVLITEKTADQKQTHSDIHDQELLRSSESIVMGISSLCVCEGFRNN